MPIPVELEPRPLSESYFNNEDLTAAICREFNNELTFNLADQVLRPQFAVATTLEALHSRADTVASQVFGARYAEERQYEFSGTQVHDYIGDKALADSAVIELMPDETFMTHVHDQIDLSRTGVEELERLHSLWPEGVFEYLAGLKDIFDSRDVDRGDQAFELVKQMINDPEAITLPAGSSEGLYLITYLPWSVRTLTRRALTGVHLVEKMRGALGDAITPHESMMLEALRKYYILDNMTGQHWEFKDFPLNPKSQVEEAQYGAQQMDVLAELQGLADSEGGLYFKDVWETVTGQLYEKMKDISRSSATSQWACEDIGHCFGGFRPHDLYKAFRKGFHSEPRENYSEFKPKKSGLKAAILEDDNDQRALWREAVDAHTSFSTDDSLVFPTPEGIEAASADQNVGYFLLDIQNFDDPTAGIRIGHQIIEERLEMGRRSPDGKAPKTHVIIWSASSEAVTVATQHFRKLVKHWEAQGIEINYELDGSAFLGSSGITLEVRPKKFKPYKDMK